MGLVLETFELLVTKETDLRVISNWVNFRSALRADPVVVTYLGSEEDRRFKIFRAVMKHTTNIRGLVITDPTLMMSHFGILPNQTKLILFTQLE